MTFFILMSHSTLAATFVQLTKLCDIYIYILIIFIYIPGAQGNVTAGALACQSFCDQEQMCRSFCLSCAYQVVCTFGWRCDQEDVCVHRLTPLFELHVGCVCMGYGALCSTPHWQSSSPAHTSHHASWFASWHCPLQEHRGARESGYAAKV